MVIVFLKLGIIRFQEIDLLSSLGKIIFQLSIEIRQFLESYFILLDLCEWCRQVGLQLSILTLELFKLTLHFLNLQLQLCVSRLHAFKVICKSLAFIIGILPILMLLSQLFLQWFDLGFQLSDLLVFIIDLVIGSIKFSLEFLDELVLRVDLVLETNDLLSQIMNLSGLTFVIKIKFILKFSQMGNFVQ